MKTRLWRFAHFLIMAMTFATVMLLPAAVGAAPYAAYVMDARTGEVLYQTNANTRLHPASLTKMMTLYIAFEAIERGEISLDTMVKVSKHAAAEPPSRLGLKAGQKIQLRYLIRAAAIKSANDAATAIGEAISGSEAAFSKRMNRTAKAIGMKDSTFKNANGLTGEGHMSTARDLTILGRRLFYDYPQYYNIFSRRSTDAGVASVNNTNRSFLNSYKGADGIKTGFTNPAGFNLTASAERNGTRIIATVLGGKSTAHRNAKMTELLDLGFGKAPSGANVPEPAAPVEAAIADAGTEQGGTVTAAPQTLAMNSSPRPKLRPETVTPSDDLADALKDSIAAALAEAAAPDAGAAVPTETAEAVATAGSEGQQAGADAVAAVSPAPALPATAPMPRPTPEEMYADADPAAVIPVAAPQVVARISTSGGRQWGINVGRYPSRAGAERQLLKTALSETVSLNESLRKVVARDGEYDATFVGLTQDQADLACRRLQARSVQCFTMGP